jgi:hypothetical protein
MFLAVITNPRERLEECLVYLCCSSRAERLFSLFVLLVLKNVFSNVNPPVKMAPGSWEFAFGVLVNIV